MPAEGIDIAVGIRIIIGTTCGEVLAQDLLNTETHSKLVE